MEETLKLNIERLLCCAQVFEAVSTEFEGLYVY